MDFAWHAGWAIAANITPHRKYIERHERITFDLDGRPKELSAFEGEHVIGQVIQLLIR